MLAIWKRELQNYYLTPIGYVFMGIFLLVGGVMFYLGNIMGMTPSAATLLGNLNYIFMLTVPILTMRLLSEERRTKTDQLLITSPLRLGVNILLQILESVFSSSSFALPGALSFLRPVLSWFSLYSRYNQFAAGRLSFANILYYLSFSGLMLFLTVRVIDRRRWSEG